MNEGNSFRFDLWLYNEMKKRNWNTMDMERKTGIKHCTFSNYLHNKCMPNMYMLALILKAFNMHMVFEQD